MGKWAPIPCTGYLAYLFENCQLYSLYLSISFERLLELD